MKVSSKVKNITNNCGVISIDTDGGRFRIMFINESLMRIHCTFEENFKEEASYALVMTAWEDKMDYLFKDERKRVALYIPVFEEHESYICIKTGKLKAIINMEPFGIDVYDSNGCLLMSDVKQKSYIRDRMGRVYHYTCIEDNDYFYGFGEKTGYLNKAKRRLRMNNVDTIGYDSEITDPLYKHIPFYIKLSGKTKTACGFFYNNSYESIFDMGCERSGYWNKYSYFCGDGGDIDLFLVYGPKVKDVVEGYTDLTGKTALPPLYSLGYMGSTMYYTELDSDSDDAVLGFMEKTKQQDIPCDGFCLSSGYTTGDDNKRHVFNWNRKRFKNPGGFVEEMKKKGGALVPNIKPGLLITNPLYNEFKSKGAFIKDSGGKPHMDKFWGGSASFVDFTNPVSREVWKKHLKESLISQGITAVWNDNCEFEVNDSEAICDFEGSKERVFALRPFLPNMMSFSARQAISEYYPHIRPYIMSRSGFAGIQRYAQTWSGDNNTSWKSLKFSIPVILGMGLSGVANQGCDIGGFYGSAPEPELFVRWVQNGIFQPRFCIHSCNTDNTVTEPWMYPSYTSYIREAIKFRYKLIPYLYSLIYEASTVGSPIMRPLIYEFQDDVKVYEESFNFMFGPYMLVANVIDKNALKKEVYLPKGYEWYDWNTRERYNGGQTITINTPLHKIPVFFRSGAIIPQTEAKLSLQHECITKLNILIEPGLESQFLLYEDDGVTNDYLKGVYCQTLISIRHIDKGVIVLFESCGSFSSKISEILLDIICKDTAPLFVSIKECKLKQYIDKDLWEMSREGWYYNPESRSVQVKYTKPRQDYSITLDFNNNDLISI